MVITTKQLRVGSGRIVSQAANGQEITITYRGKPCAKIVPFAGKKKPVLDSEPDELFGIWKNKAGINDVEQFVRNIRKGRKL